MAEDKESRTERATQRRREEAREHGKVARSQEVPLAILLLSVLLALWGAGNGIWTAFVTISRELLGHVSRGELTVAGASRMLSGFAETMLVPLMPVAGVMVFAALLSSVGQVGFKVTGQPLIPDLKKFNPVSGLQKFFGLQSVAQLVVSVLKMTAVLVVGYLTIRSYMPDMIGLFHSTPLVMAKTVSRATLDLGVRVSLLLLVIAALDYVYQKWQYERDLRMTKEEVKEEMKMTEGDPQIKQRIRSVQLTMARQRMLSDVAKADVVVRNPTHYAVALKYDPLKASAPRVLAKGADYVAQRILEAARKHRVPTTRDAPLAQALYRACKVGDVIPPKLYRAVARLLVHVFQRSGKPIPGIQGTG